MTTINNTHKTTTTIHTRQLQQYTQGNYKFIHKTPNNNTQDNYNDTHKTTTTIHTRHLKIQHVQKVNNTKSCQERREK